MFFMKSGAVFPEDLHLVSKWIELNTIEEQSLAEACRRGEMEARRMLYEQYAGRLFAICLRYVADRATAEDLLHDSFLKIFGSLDRFTYRGKGSLRAWMERVTVNTTLEWLRQRSRLEEEPIEESRSVRLAEDESAVDVERIPARELMRLIEELPEGYRVVFNLFYVEGYSHAEIARMLGIKEKSSSSQLFRARALLARKIRDYEKNN